MINSILLQAQGMPLVEKIYIVLGIIISLSVILGFLIRSAVRESKKVDKSELEKLLKGKVDKETTDKITNDLNQFICDHEKEHEAMKKMFIDLINESAKRQSDALDSIIDRMKENLTNQREVNNDIIKKLDNIIPKIARIEANTEVLMEDYNNR